MSILQTTTTHYQTTLHNTPKALKHLKEKSITNRNTIDTFLMGFAASNLKDIADPRTIKEFVKAGLLNLNNRDFFNNAFTVPLYDLEGQLVNIYSQSLLNQSQIKFLNDKQGFANISALSSSDEVYVSDSLYVTLELHQAGYRNILFMPMKNSGELLNGKRFIVINRNHPKELAEQIAGGEIFYTAHSHNTKSIEHSLARKQRYIPSVELKPSCSILDKVVADLDTLGYVGESLNKKLAYLVSISRKLSRPLSAIIISSSGAGKTGLMKAVSELVPSEDKLMLSRLTPQALFHMPKDALMEKLIVVDERNGSSMADYSIRTMQTSNVLTMAKPITKDDNSGIKSINVKCAYMESTTSENVNPENASRCFLLHLDESPEATRAILESQRKSRGHSKQIDRKVLLDWHHKFQRTLQSLPVAIPFIESICFPYHQVSFRREQEKFLSLIEAVALVNQQSREIINGVIMANKDDYAIAYELFIKIFKDQQKEITRNAQAFLHILEEEAYLQFTIRQALSFTSWSYGKLHRTISELLKYDYLTVNTTKKGRHTKVYSVQDYKPYLMHKVKLTHPDELSINNPPSIQQQSINNPSLESASKSIENNGQSEMNRSTIHNGARV